MRANIQAGRRTYENVGMRAAVVLNKKIGRLSSDNVTIYMNKIRRKKESSSIFIYLSRLPTTKHFLKIKNIYNRSFLSVIYKN